MMDIPWVNMASLRLRTSEIPCPRCKAPTLEPCTNLNTGTAVKSPHQQRWVRAMTHKELVHYERTIRLFRHKR